MWWCRVFVRQLARPQTSATIRHFLKRTMADQQPLAAVASSPVLQNSSESLKRKDISDAELEPPLKLPREDAKETVALVSLPQTERLPGGCYCFQPCTSVTVLNEEKAKTVSNETTEDGVSTSTDTAEEQRVRPPKKFRYAFLMSYCGDKYYGMQIQNTGASFPTVEYFLFEALFHYGHMEKGVRPQQYGFQRACRTDKGVSAVRQICNMDLRVEPTELESVRQQLNEKMPPDIRIMGIKRTTKNFNGKNSCNSRIYSYTLPTYAFTHVDEITEDAFRIPSSRIKEVNELLELYIGSHNFFNFTSGIGHEEMCARRFIIDCSCGQPFMHEELEFVTITVEGQSFMIHQIRKMIGLCIAIVRGFGTKEHIEKAWLAERLDVPRAPGLGLMLEKVNFKWYDGKFADVREPLDSWPECEAEIEEFKKSMILPVIYKGEKEEHSMMNWLATLPLHDYTHSEAEKYVGGTRANCPMIQAHKNISNLEKQQEQTEGSVTA